MTDPQTEETYSLPTDEALADADTPETAAVDELVDPADGTVANDVADADTPLDLDESALPTELDGEGDEAEYDDEPIESPYDRPGKWYVVHTQSGYEKKVKSNLEARIQSMNMEDQIFEVVIPMEDSVEFKNGKKVVVQKKIFPGYLLVRCHLSDESWFVIRNTPGATGFVGQGQRNQKPAPLTRREVETFLMVKPEGAPGTEAATRRSKPKPEYELNEVVRVKEGPFADFSGQVAEINMDQLKLKVLVNIFGRETLVEMEFSQVAKF